MPIIGLLLSLIVILLLVWAVRRLFLIFGASPQIQGVVDVVIVVLWVVQVLGGWTVGPLIRWR